MVFKISTDYHQLWLCKKLHVYSKGRHPSCFCWLCSRTLVSKHILHFSVQYIRWRWNGLWYTVTICQQKNQSWPVIRILWT